MKRKIHKKLMCNKCYNTIDLKIKVSANVDYIMYENIDIDAKSYCEKCNRFTTFFTVDSNCADCIRLLNIKGYNTKFSCEGHINVYKEELSEIWCYTFIAPYIRFSDGIINTIDKDIIDMILQNTMFIIKNDDISLNMDRLLSTYSEHIYTKKEAKYFTNLIESAMKKEWIKLKHFISILPDKKEK